MQKTKLLLVSTCIHNATTVLSGILQDKGYDCLHIQSLKALEIVHNNYQPHMILAQHHEMDNSDLQSLIYQYSRQMPLVVLMWMPGLKQGKMMRFLNFGILQIDSLNDPCIMYTIESETKQRRNELVRLEKSS